MAEEKEELTAEKIRRINYNIIDKLWEAIAERAIRKLSATIKSDVIDRYKAKTDLYRALGTYKTDFSSYKSGRKEKLSKTMISAIRQVNFEAYPNSKITDEIPKWTEKVKNVLLGNELLEVEGLEAMDILNIHGDIENSDRKEILEKIKRHCKNIVEAYWENISPNSTYDALCIWLSLVMQEKYSVYVKGQHVRDAIVSMKEITVDDLNNCELTVLKDNIKEVEVILKKMKVIYEYRKLTKK